MFKHKHFRKNQRAIINAILSNENVFVLMPTGYGKSLCFQIPAIYNEGITIIISPLISLIQDQIIQLEFLDLKVIGLFGRNKNYAEILNDVISSKNIKIIYTTPETLLTSFVNFKLHEIHGNRKIERFILDEAHCVSKWG